MSEFVEKPVGASVLQSVRLVGRLRRPKLGYRFAASSLPGHLLQVTVQGASRHEVGGRQYDLSKGSLIWYHEDESVRGVVRRAPWVLYTVNFIAPSLSPPPFEQRVRKVDQRMINRFASLLEAWNDLKVADAAREMRVQSNLLSILSHLQPTDGQPYRMEPSARPWWDLETMLRGDLSQQIDLTRMCELAGKSIATIARSCMHAVGVPPMKRVKQIRMSFARGLVQRSGLSFSEIAERTGYPRVHEFSRDYRRHFGVTATEERSRSR
jgi:AraC-like DNA-binding protein